MPATPARFSATLAALVLAGSLCGCLERRLSITTEPPGALVYVNDVELGRTPLEADFTFYGEYDVRAELEGYEPLRTRASANAPIQEIPPFDIVAMALPFDIEKTVRWHFVLQPTFESTMDPRQMEDGLVTRAKELRTMTAGETQPAATPAARAPDSSAPPSSTKPADQSPASPPADPK